MKVLLDIDGVLANFYAGFADYLNKTINAELDLNDEPSEYSIHKWNSALPRELVDKQLEEMLKTDGFINTPIYSGAKEFVFNLLDKYDVYIVTARIGDFKLNLGSEIKANIENSTKQWFINHGIPANKLFFEHKKINFCKQNNIKVIIEDKLSTVIDAVESNILSILMHRNWNKNGVMWYGKKLDRNHNNLYIAYTYDDILNILGYLND